MRFLLAPYRHVLKNLAWLSLASAAVKPLWFAFITFGCARVLGADGYGAFNTALSLGALCFAFTGFGINQYTVREVAADPAVASRFFTNFVAFRVVAYALAALAALVAAWLLDYDGRLILAVGLACLYQAATSLREYAHSFFQAFERLRYQAVSVVVEKVVVVALGLAALLVLGSVEGTILGMSLGMVLTTGGAVWWVARHLAPLQRESLDRAFLVRSLRPLIPFGLLSLFGMFFFRVDTVMVEAIGGLTAAGQYGLAFRIVEALNLLPVLVAQAAAYPRMARLAGAGTYGELGSVVWATVGLLLLVSLPAALAVALVADPLIGWISPDPQLGPAAAALRVLAWSLPLTSLRSTLSFALLALRDQRLLAWMLGLGVAFNIGLNLALIPQFGVQGAVYATLASEACLLAAHAVRYRIRIRTLTT
ncbi:MAG: flippase [Bacteroidota bacterium]